MAAAKTAVSRTLVENPEFLSRLASGDTDAIEQLREIFRKRKMRINAVEFEEVMEYARSVEGLLVLPPPPRRMHPRPSLRVPQLESPRALPKPEFIPFERAIVSPGAATSSVVGPVERPGLVGVASWPPVVIEAGPGSWVLRSPRDSSVRPSSVVTTLLAAGRIEEAAQSISSAPVSSRAAMREDTQARKALIGKALIANEPALALNELEHATAIHGPGGAWAYQEALIDIARGRPELAAERLSRVDARDVEWELPLELFKVLGALARGQPHEQAVELALFRTLPPEAATRDPFEVLIPMPGKGGLTAELLAGAGALHFAPGSGAQMRGRVHLDRVGEKWVFTSWSAQVTSPEPILDAALRERLSIDGLGLTISRDANTALSAEQRAGLGAFRERESLLAQRLQEAFEIQRSGNDDAQITELRHFATEPGREQFVVVRRLQGRGDTILQKTPDGSYLLIDTGLSKADAVALRAEIPPGVKLRVLVTHRDADHLAGLRELLLDPAIEIVEVVIGASDSAGGDLWREIRGLLPQRLMTKNHPVKTVHHFVSEGDTGMLMEVRAADKFGFHDIQLRPSGGSTFRVLQYGDARSENDAALVAFLEHKGKTMLLTSDIGARVMNKLMETPTVDLRAGILKWPHHAWFPSEPSDQAIVRQFLRRVNPHTVIISNIGASSHEHNFDKIRNLVHQELGDSVQVLWTKQEGTLKFITMRLAPLACPLAVPDPGEGVCIRRAA